MQNYTGYTSKDIYGINISPLEYWKISSKTQKIVEAGNKIGGWTDKKFVLEQVAKDCRFIGYAEGKVGMDKEVILAALKQNGYATNFIRGKYSEINNMFELLSEDNDMKKKINHAIKVVEEGNILEWENLDESIRNNRYIMLMLAKKNYAVLECAGEELLYDKEFILEAVKYDYRALEVASYDILTDKEFMSMVYKINPEAIKYSVLKPGNWILKSEIKRDNNGNITDKEFILKLVEENPLVLEYISDELYQDKDFQKEVKTVILNKEKKEKEKQQGIIDSKKRNNEREDR